MSFPRARQLSNERLPDSGLCALILGRLVPAPGGCPGQELASSRVRAAPVPGTEQLLSAQVLGGTRDANDLVDCALASLRPSRVDLFVVASPAADGRYNCRDGPEHGRNCERGQRLDDDKHEGYDHEDERRARQDDDQQGFVHAVTDTVAA